jgi:Fe-S cluster assembly scaffold protein SufB
MKIEVGDMIVGGRDYGIVTEIKEEKATIHWFDMNSDYNCTMKYWANALESTIDGKTNKLVKAKQ